jgi:hypothetical protein
MTNEKLLIKVNETAMTDYQTSCWLTELQPVRLLAQYILLVHFVEQSQLYSDLLFGLHHDKSQATRRQQSTWQIFSISHMTFIITQVKVQHTSVA